MYKRQRQAQVPEQHARQVVAAAAKGVGELGEAEPGLAQDCLLYTSDAADERSSVDLGGRRII